MNQAKNARPTTRHGPLVWVVLMLVSLILAHIGSAGSAVAKVYKWTDANGKVHYGERPPPGTTGESVRVPKSDNTSTAPVGDAERRARQRKLLRAFEDDRKEREANKAKTRKQEAKLKRACEKMRKYIANEADAKFLYRKDKQTGEKVPVSEAERSAHMSKVR